jgi:hypothetical protein
VNSVRCGERGARLHDVRREVGVGEVVAADQGEDRRQGEQRERTPAGYESVGTSLDFQVRNSVFPTSNGGRLAS